MTTLNTWIQPEGARAGELRAYVQCDGCLPGLAMGGTADRLRRNGWRFEDLESGPHLCPSCAYRDYDGTQRRLSPPSQRPSLPNLLVIGATKAGTTALHTFLSLHPEIEMSADKELNFFIHPSSLEHLDDYASFFDARAPLRGETSPLYTYDPIVPGVPERIRAALPGVKLIYLVRDPVERALSDYVHYSAVWEEESLDEAFARPEDAHNLYGAPSMYSRQLERYLEHFRPDQILVLDQAQLLADGSGTMSAVFSFLGADEDFTSTRFGELVNPAEARRRMTPTGRWLRSSGLANVLRRLPSGPRESVLRTARRLMFRAPAPAAPAREELRERLCAAFAADAARLRELSGQEFASWQV